MKESNISSNHLTQLCAFDCNYSNWILMQGKKKEKKKKK